VTIAVPTGLGETRNALVVMGVDAVVALPGAYGTLSEVAHALNAGTPVVGLGHGWMVSGVIPAKSPMDAVDTALARPRA
jgi:predicted Rossmann-fold nucleotide-binding protein